MKQIILTLSLTFLSLTNYGQSKIVKEISSLLQSGQIDLAEEKVNKYLEKDSNEIDALMMKGNVIYFQYNQNRPDIALSANNDESIYDQSIGYMQEPIDIVPVNIANQITDLWQKAVSLDLNRQDIHYGICHMYSISLQADKLIDYLPTLFENIKVNDKTQYNFANYARNLKDRDDIFGAMKVYWKISELFPNNAGIYSDMAAEYYLQGDYDNAQKCLEIVLDKKIVDEMSYGNAFFILAISENVEKALIALKKQSELNKNQEYLLYQGLIELNKNGNWKNTLTEYLNTKKHDVEGEQLAKLLLNNDLRDSEKIIENLKQINLHDGFKILISKYLSENSADYISSFSYAETLTYHKRHSKAVTIFEKIDTSNIDKEIKEAIIFNYAWALYKSENITKSNSEWEKLISSDNFYYKSAAAYFIGNYYFKNNDFKEASKYFNLVSDKASESKYATMCWNRLK